MPPVRTQLKLPFGREKGGIVKERRPPKVAKVRTDVILSIKPEFAELIAQRAKNYEYRKYKLAGVERIWLYETAPTSKLTLVMTTTHPKVPGEVQDPSGVGNDDFDEGKKVSKFGYPVLHLHKLKEPISIGDMKRYGLSAPQGYVYAPTQLVEDFPLGEMIEVF
ncbi:MAG: hypothetical protein M1813_001306 [Trichoglossum hirsutum]|nr:MAG: hypothetical protein M1813_001306 [Trichoglossum hirsutum]